MPDAVPAATLPISGLGTSSEYAGLDSVSLLATTEITTSPWTVSVDWQ